MTTVSDHRKTRTAAGPASRAAPPGLTGPPPGEAQPSLSHRSRRGHRRRGDVGNVDVGPSHRRRDAGETSAQPRVRAGPSHRHARRAAVDRGPWVSLPLRATIPEGNTASASMHVDVGPSHRRRPIASSAGAEGGAEGAGADPRRNGDDYPMTGT